MSLRAAMRKCERAMITGGAVLVERVQVGYVVYYSGKAVPFITLDGLCVFLGDDARAGWLCLNSDTSTNSN